MDYSTTRKKKTSSMKCLLIEVRHFHLSSKGYQNTEIQFCSNIIVLLICACISSQHKFSKNWNLFSKQSSYLEAADNHVY